MKFGAKSIINGVEHILKPSDEYGFIEQDLCLSEKEIFDLATPISAGSRDRKFSYEIQSHETKNDRPPQSFSCTIYVLASHGISVISDIDDTIKVSNVVSRRALLRHTFCHSFQPVHGMSEVYRKWSEQHCQFHYVSASPWQLYVEILQTFSFVFVEFSKTFLVFQISGVELFLGEISISIRNGQFTTVRVEIEIT